LPPEKPLKSNGKLHRTAKECPPEGFENAELLLISTKQSLPAGA
jgi:hypothetical protein